MTIGESIGLVLGIAYLAGAVWFSIQMLRDKDDGANGCIMSFLYLFFFPVIIAFALVAAYLELLNRIIKGLFALAVRKAPRSWIENAMPGAVLPEDAKRVEATPDAQEAPLIPKIGAALESKTSDGTVFRVGQSVRIMVGPFKDFSGYIGSIGDDGQTLRVIVSIFQRDSFVDFPLDGVHVKE
jgi:hypothetical protein